MASSRDDLEAIGRLEAATDMERRRITVPLAAVAVAADLALIIFAATTSLGPLAVLGIWTVFCCAWTAVAMTRRVRSAPIWRVPRASLIWVLWAAGGAAVFLALWPWSHAPAAAGLVLVTGVHIGPSNRKPTRGWATADRTSGV